MKRFFRRLLRVIIVLIAIGIIGTIVVFIYLEHPKFGSEWEADSPRGERILASPNYYNGEFQNLEPMPPTPDSIAAKAKGRIATLYEVLFERGEITRPKDSVPALKTDIIELSQQNEDLLVWFGHSSYYMQIGGLRLLFDPVFYDGSPLSFINSPFDGTDIYKPSDMPEVDYIAITHDHWDHLDYRAIDELKHRTKYFICPLGVGEHLEHWGIATDRILELDWNESIFGADGLKVTALPARHYSSRLFARNQTLWCGYMVEADSLTIYMSGDSGYGIHIEDIARRYPAIDLAVLENGQFDEQWRYIHFVPRDLVRAVKELNPKRFITSHNSKFAIARHGWTLPMDEIYSAAQSDSLPLLTPMVGGVIGLRDTTITQSVWWR